jgi:hypothetical protein
LTHTIIEVELGKDSRKSMEYLDEDLMNNLCGGIGIEVILELQRIRNLDNNISLVVS